MTSTNEIINKYLMTQLDGKWNSLLNERKVFNIIVTMIIPT